MSGTQVNAMIPLQAGQGVPQIDPARVMQTVALYRQLQQQQQAQQGQNAIRAIFSDPASIDQKTGMPTSNAMNRIMAADPATGMALRQNMLKTEETEARTAFNRSKVNAALQDQIRDVGTESLEAYEKAMADGHSPAEARSVAQDVYTQGYNGIKSSGLAGPEIINNLSPTFDPVRVRTNIDWFKRRDENRKFALEKERADTEAASAGLKTLGNPVSVQVKATDGSTKQTMAVYDKATGKWLAAEGRQPIEGDVQPVKAAPPGSEAEMRAAVASDVDNDPAFKDMTPGQRATEVQRQVTMAKSGMGDKDIDGVAKQIASYQQAPLSSFAMARGAGPKIMARVQELNPDYQSARYGEVNRAMTAFGTGKQGDTIRALNVATQHLETIDKAADALRNGDVRMFNSLGNTIAAETGSAAPTTFDALKQIVGTEIEKAVSGGIGAVADRDRLMAALNSANSPAQLAEVSSNFKQLMAGQAKGLKKQYEDATGFTSGEFAFDKKLMPATTKALGLIDKADKPVGKPSSLPQAKQDEGAIPVLTSKAAYDALPSGSKYRKDGDPPGKWRVKP